MSNQSQEGEHLTLKQKLKLVFDDDLRTPLPHWKNIIDYIIIALIIISAVEVFLSTFSSIAGRYGTILNFIDKFTVIFFTIEIALRIWTADLLDKRYEGFTGRVRYCCSFYGLIDLVSIIPFYINLLLPTPYSILKIFRVFRLLRLFRYMPSSRLLFKAVSSKKNELAVSLAFLTLLTVILSALLYFVEHDAQPEQCENGWSTFVWAFAKYLGDPGKIADFTLLTPWANFIAFIVGLLGVAIFAVPTGLIGSGFTEAMEEEKRKKQLARFRQRMTKAFRRQTNRTLNMYVGKLSKQECERTTDLCFTPQRVPIAKMQVRQGMDIKDIIDTCNAFPEFRLKNLASARSGEEKADDRLVIEHFPLNRPYGYYKPSDSNVTIVCTGGFSEVGIGWFTYYLAKMGGFNYICKDLEADPDELDSFFNMSKEPLFNRKKESDHPSLDKEARKILQKKEKLRAEFDNDWQEAVGDNGWVIIFTSQIKSSANMVDFHFSDAKKDGADSTVTDQATYQKLCEQFAAEMNKDCKLECVLRSTRYPHTEKNLGYRIRENKPNSNVFVIRPSTDIINFDIHKIEVAYRMARLFSNLLDGGRGMQGDYSEDFKSPGFGFKENIDNKKEIEEIYKEMHESD